MHGGVDYMIKGDKARRLIIFGFVLTLGLYGCSTQNMSIEPEIKEDKRDIFGKVTIYKSIGDSIVTPLE